MSIVRRTTKIDFIEAVDYNSVVADLIKLQTASGTTSVSYTLSLFNGTGYDSEKVRSILMLATVASTSYYSSPPSFIKFTTPIYLDDPTWTEANAIGYGWGADQSDIDGEWSRILKLPIKNGVTSIAYDLTASGAFGYTRSKIIGFQQIE
jgi:hypothetical protein